MPKARDIVWLNTMTPFGTSNLAISRIVVETLESLRMEFPKPSVDIEEIKKKYHAIVEQEGDGPKAELDTPAGVKNNK